MCAFIHLILCISMYMCTNICMCCIYIYCVYMFLYKCIVYVCIDMVQVYCAYMYLHECIHAFTMYALRAGRYILCYITVF